MILCKKVGRERVYAIVRAGGRQEKVAVGDLIEQDRVEGELGATVTLPAVLLVDGDNVTHEPKALDKTKITAEIVEHTLGDKIEIGKYKNKTGYRKRQGHRQHLTILKVTAIKPGK